MKAKKILYASMRKIGFEVRIIENPDSAVGHGNPDRPGVLEIIDSYVHRGDQIDCNAFGVAFTSHGKRNGRMATFRDIINVEQIVNQVKGAKALVGKPKLFFFQG